LKAKKEEKNILECRIEVVLENKGVSYCFRKNDDMFEMRGGKGGSREQRKR